MPESNTSTLTIKIQQSSIWYGAKMGRWNNLPAVWWSNVYFDRLGIIWWDSAVGCWLGVRAFQTVLYRITLKLWFHFFTQFLAKFLSKSFQIIFLLNYSLICPKTKSELFPIYQNKHWTISWHIVSLYYILKIVGFMMTATIW